MDIYHNSKINELSILNKTKVDRLPDSISENVKNIVLLM